MDGIILDYFRDIYSTSFPADFGASLGAVDRKVSDTMNEDLLSKFRAEEVRRALKQMSKEGLIIDDNALKNASRPLHASPISK